MRVLLPVAIVFCSSLSAQTTFAPDGAKWTYLQGIISGPDTNIAEIEVVGDTMIAGRTCSHLVQNSGWSICHEFLTYLTMSGDSLSYWDQSTSEFHLLFDWSSTVGSTWSTPITQADQLIDTLDWSVLDTGHVTIDGVPFRSFDVSVMSRQWTLFSPNVGIVIERLGGMSAPFTWEPGFCDAESFIALRCYEDQQFSWLSPQFSQCDLSTSIPEHGTGTSLWVYPTILEAEETITVTAPSGALVDVVDATERLVNSLKNASQELRFTMQEPGLYFVRANIGSRPIGTQRILVR